MPGPAGAEHRRSAANSPRLVQPLSVALVVIRISRLAQVHAALSLKHVFTPDQMTELGHCIAQERDQNPAKPSGLL
jgi:hypothetical protein